MILQSLNQLYDRLAADERYRLPGAGYSKQDITFEVVLNSDGSLQAINDARVEEVTIDKKGKEKRKQNPLSLSVPGEARASEASLAPGFLWDDTRFVFGWHSDPKKNPERIHECFHAFVERHTKLRAEICSDAFAAVCSFLEKWSPGDAQKQPALLAVGKGRCVFRIIGQQAYVHDDPAVRKWWNEHSPMDSDEKGYCLITGGDEKRDIARLHLGIFGLPGTPYTGAALASFNCDSFTSYGKSKNDNSPVSVAAAFRYGNALNALLDGPRSHRHKIRIADITAVFWTEHEGPVEAIFAEFLEGRVEQEQQTTLEGDGLRQNLETFLKILRQGGGAQVSELGEDPNEKFYILGLSLSQGRLSVRFWHVGSIAQMVDRLKAHYDALRIVRSRENDPEFPPLWMLLDEIVPLKKGRPDRERLPPNLPGEIMMSILNGSDYPLTLLHLLLRRIRTSERVSETRLRNRVSYRRAALLQCLLNRNYRKNMNEALDPKRPEAAYHLGRLFGVYETAQRHAHDWKLNRTIRETMYSSASATPLSVFARLERLFHHHTREKRFPPGSSQTYATIVSEINQQFRGAPIYPATLDLSDQALFSVGYYHQMHFFRSLAEATQTNTDQFDDGERNET